MIASCVAITYPVHADPAPPAPAPRPAAAKTPLAPAAMQLWCFSYGHKEFGACTATSTDCEQGLAELRKQRPTEQFEPCAERRTAVCFDAERKTGTGGVCHPTFSICRTHRDYLRANPEDGTRVLSECARQPRPPAGSVTDPAEAAHWWCLTIGRGNVGSCDRSKGLCEKNRQFAQTKNGSPSECTPLRSALCFDVHATGKGARTLCSPNAQACKAQHDFEKTQAGTGAQVTDCKATP